METRCTAPGYFDMHVHTQSSHDSTTPLQTLIRTAVQNGTTAFAVTDHCDIQYYHERDMAGCIARSMAELSSLEEESPVKLLRGVEIGEGLWNPEAVREILDAHPYDIVLGSVHAVRYKSYTDPFSGMDFSGMTDGELDGYLRTYFDDMLEMLHVLPCDVLTHLTNPMKYMVGKYGRHVELRRYEAQILGILRCVVQRGIALEVNTGCLDRIYGALMPDLWILRAYRELGGTRITLGSDAHTADRLSYGFSSILPLLKEAGFTACYRYEQRRPVACPI